MRCRKNFCIIAISLILVVEFISRIQGAELTLVENGAPKATIVLSDKPTKAAQLAAFEIQEHVKLITGATLPIVGDDANPVGLKIFVGPSKHAGAPKNFKNQEYAVQFKPNAIVIAGKDKQYFGKVDYWYAGTPKIKGAYGYMSWPGLFDAKGTLYAAYDFLEEYCGVRWFDQSEFGTDVPKTKTLSVTAKNIRRVPAFSYRDPQGRIKGNMDIYDRGASLWTVKWSKSTPKYQEWLDLIYEKGRKLPVCKHPHRWLAYERSHVYAYLLRRKMGGEAYKTNHSFYSWYDRFWKKNPKKPEVFEKRHPDWFAQGYPEAKVPPQLCYSNPEVVKQCLADARAFFAMSEEDRAKSRLGTDKFFPVVPMDNTNYCKCPRCMKLGPAQRVSPQYSSGDHSKRVWSFVNAIAKGLKKSNPGKMVSALAYSSYAYRPKDIKLEDNIAVQMCLFPHWAASNPEGLKNDDMILKQWADGRPLYLWLYMGVTTGHKPKVPMFPKPMEKLYGPLLRKYHKAGVRGIFFDGMPQETDTYFLLKLTENPYQDSKKLVDDYFVRMYGPKAGKTLKKFYTLVENIYTNPRNHPKGAKGPELYYGILGTGPRMKKLGALVHQAEKELVGAQELWRKRFAMFKFGTWDYMKEGRAQYEKHKVVKASKPVVIYCPLLGSAVADANPAKVDWRDSQGFGGHNGWLKDSGDISLRKIAAKIAHYSKCLYLNFNERNFERKPGNGDSWEILLRGAKGKTSYKLIVDPAGKVQGRIIMDAGVPQDWNTHGAKALSKISGDNWNLVLSLPIKEEFLDKHGRMFMNCRRNDKTGEDSPVLVATGNNFESSKIGALISFDKPLSGELKPPVNSDLSLDWTFAGSGKTVKDHSGHGNDGLLYGAPKRVDDSIDITRGGQYIEARAIKGLDAKNFTFTCWLKYRNAHTQGGLRIFTWGKYQCMLAVPYQKILFLGRKKDGKISGSGPFGPELTPRIWHMFTLTGTEKGLSVFENGRRRGGVDFKRYKLLPPVADAPWLFGGAHKFKTWQTFLGQLKHIQFYKRALSPQEIMAKYKSEYMKYRK